MKLFLAIIFFIIAVAGMFFFLFKEPVIDSSLGFPLVMIGILSIIAFSWAGLFQRSIISYVVFSTIIQAAYFVLDAGSAIMIGKSIWFAFLQALNFTIAGGLFMLVFALLYFAVKKNDLVDYAGLYEKNKFLVFVLSLSCLSLGGMAGFNIFVGEFLLYSFLFKIHPALAISAIFAGLVCFLFYFRICYTLLVHKSDKTIHVPLILKLIAGVLGVLVVVLGVVPYVLLEILEMVI
ncbi:MAG: proton-conducting transporter membrane subunit [Candidatus Micrarchaeota archaeon]|nr:hypothetical protein [Candidatus Micrarchaeota archaeon]MBU1681567.1 hypothetical protein [Candidatus Micrarchaeota archaeon]